ncbi:MAG: nuclear transport factor 2 family protein [Chloroflexota bacterium]
MSVEAVLNHHLEGFSSGDVDAVMEDYTDESVLIMPDATYKGLDSIRAVFAGLFSGLFKPGTYQFTMDRSEISQDTAYIVWHSTNEGADVKLGTDTFLIQDKKITLQTFAAFVEEN